MEGVPGRNLIFFTAMVIIVVGIVGGAAYAVSAGNSLTSSGSSAASDQGCQVYPGSTQPNLFGEQVDSVRQVTLSENYTRSQLQKATEAVLNDRLISPS